MELWCAKIYVKCDAKREMQLYCEFIPGYRELIEMSIKRVIKLFYAHMKYISCFCYINFPILY